MFNGTNDRIVHFGYGDVAKIELMNSELKIHQDFDLSKDTKFSTRTLLLLCVFCIGVFGFGLSPNFFGYNLSTNYRYFAIFCLCVLIGQSFITWFQYSLNKEKLKRYLSKQEEEIDRLIYAQKEAQQKIDGFHNKRNEILKKPFPQTVSGQQVANSTKDATPISIDSIACEYAHLDEFRQMGATLIEMETATFFKAMQIIGKPASALLVVSDNSAVGQHLFGQGADLRAKYHAVRSRIKDVLLNL